MKKIVLAGGCFWGVEAYFNRLKGVLSTKVGYANGKIVNPTYDQVKTGETEFVESVEVQYDETTITLEKLLEHLFRIIDPTSINQQGFDIGSQYRSGVYYETKGDMDRAMNYIIQQQNLYQKPIVVEVKKLVNFYDAETYHQKYLDKNPSGYCHVNLDLLKPEERK